MRVVAGFHGNAKQGSKIANIAVNCSSVDAFGERLHLVSFARGKRSILENILSRNS